MSLRTQLCCLAVALGALTTSQLHAASYPPRPDVDTPPAVSQPGSTSLTGRLTIPTARRLLSSAAPADRVRAIERLAAQHDYAAVQVLLQQLEENSSLVADPSVMLAAIRALRPFAAREPVRRHLAAWASDSGEARGLSGPLMMRARAEAAMALAASGDAVSTEQLAQMMLQGGNAALRAHKALLAHPPRSLKPLLTDDALASSAVVDLLGSLGDLRAVPKLRELSTKGSTVHRSHAARSLARLGDAFAVKMSRGWVEQVGSAPPVRMAAAETLVLTRAPDAPWATAVLLADPATRQAGLNLALTAPSPQVSPALAGLLTIASPAQRPAMLVALARSGGPLAVETLGKLASGNAPDSDAVYALGQCPDRGAARAIESLLQAKRTRRLGLRAAIVRMVMLGDVVPGAQEVADALMSSGQVADREVAALARVVLAPNSAGKFVESGDWLVARAACRGALWGGPDLRRACAQRVHGRMSPSDRDALSMAFLSQADLPQLSAKQLLRWAESASPSAPTYARLFAQRATQELRPQVHALLDTGGPLIRSQLFLGLGSNPQPAWIRVLVEGYDQEADPLVRRAIIRALSARNGSTRDRFLRQASELDPDDDARMLAALALAGQNLAKPSPGIGVAWVVLSPSQEGSSETAHRPVQLTLADDSVIATVTDDDGFLLVPGIAPGSVELKVAPGAENGQARSDEQRRPARSERR